MKNIADLNSKIEKIIQEINSKVEILNQSLKNQESNTLYQGKTLKHQSFVNPSIQRLLTIC